MWLAAIGILIGLLNLSINLELRLLEYLFSRTGPEIHKLYEWTYGILKNLEQLMNALDTLKDVEVKYAKYTPDPAETPADKLIKRAQDTLISLNKEFADLSIDAYERLSSANDRLSDGIEEYGRLQSEKGLSTESYKMIWEESKEHVINPVVEGIKKGYDYAKEKIGNLFRGGGGETNPYVQPFFYGERKDYRDLTEMTGSTGLPPGQIAAKMTPETYADLIVAAIPQAVKRQREMGGAGVAGETAEPEGRSVTEGDVIAIAGAVAEKIKGEAAQVAAGSGGEAAGRGQRDEEGRILTDADIAAVQAAVSNSLSRAGETGAGPKGGSPELTQTVSANQQQIIQLLTALQGGEDQIFLYQQLAYSDLVAIRNQLKEMGCDPISNMYDHRNMKI